MALNIPFRSRAYDCFISYSGTENSELAIKIATHLQNAGLSVWLDKSRMAGGSAIVDELTNQICNSRAVLLLLTKSALEKPFVKHEIEIACHQQIIVPGFKVIAAITDPTINPVERFPSLMKSSWLSFPDGEVTIETISNLITALIPQVKRESNGRHIFVSCGWGEAEQPVTARVSRFFTDRGARLVGDETSRREYGDEGQKRIHRIMMGCTGHLIILPERSSFGKNPDEIYKYFLSEFEIGKKLGLTRRILCVSKKTIPNQFKDEAIEIGSGEDNTIFYPEMIRFHDECEPNEPYVFLASDYKFSTLRNEYAKKLLEHILGMEVWMGKNYIGEQLREEIVNKIGVANIVISDLACRYDTINQHLSINLNTCIEAGVAMGSKRPLFVTSLDPTAQDSSSKDKTTQLPFMFRNSTVLWYENDVDYLLKICRLALATKRRLISDELA